MKFLEEILMDIGGITEVTLLLPLDMLMVFKIITREELMEEVIILFLQMLLLARS